MQLTLPVKVFHQQSFENYIHASNLHVVNHLQTLLNQYHQVSAVTQGICVLTGAEGHGKTHLCMATHSSATLLGYKSQYFDMASLINMPTALVDDIASNEVICLDNVDMICQNADWERTIFDLINQFIENRARLLLITSTKPIAHCEWKLKDLLTRLQWGTSFQLADLTDKDKILALNLFAENLGLLPQKNAMAYLITRVGRNMRELTEHLLFLDKISLEQGRKITIPFIKKNLDL